MECHFCGNQNKHAFFNFKGSWRCRICISFIHQMELDLQARHLSLHESEYELSFDLTPAQQRASVAISNHIKHQDVLVEAVCGAGKSELVLKSIQAALLQGQKVVWAIPRKQVVLQLQARLQHIFKALNVVGVCEGHTEQVDGDLIVCTTHQLFRYYQKVDLLILDEPDAFPYKDNPMLARFVENAVLGRIIYLTATPSVAMLAQVKNKKLAHVQLYVRPHHHPLCEPIITICSKWFMILKVVRLLARQTKQTLIFVPTIKSAQFYGKLFRIKVLTSRSENKEAIVQSFINLEIQFLICTTILERGVTFSNIDVLVLGGDHPVFDMASLIQISGRVGRDVKYPSGACYFFLNAKSKAVDQCLTYIKTANSYVCGV